MSTEMMNSTWTPEVTTQGNYTFVFDYTGTHILSVLTAPMVGINSLLLVVIITDVDMRKKPFFLNILSLCVWDLLIGLFLLTVKVDYHYSGFEWIHSQDVCRWYVAMDFSHAAISSCCVISICADRMFVKVQTTRTISTRATLIFNISVFSAPWITFFVICLPFILASEEDVEHNWGNVCIFFFEDKHFIAVIVALCTFPIIILGIFIYAILIVYICFEDTGKKLDEDDRSSLKTEMRSLRMSIIATWIVALMSLLLMLPLSILETLFILCWQLSAYCRVSWKIFYTTYIMFLVRGAITPWFWLMIPQLRKAIKQRIETIYERIRNIRRSSSTQFIYRKDDN